MNKTHKIVMLPTEDKVIEGSLISRVIDDELAIANCLTLEDKNAERDGHNNNYLYILSDDEIKTGDWCVDIEIDEVFKAKWDNPHNYKKIIATTDTLRVKEIDGEAVDLVPYIPQSLVEYYAKHQPEDVELEYVNQSFTCSKGEDCALLKGEDKCDGELIEPKDILKLQDNEVVWVEPLSEKDKEELRGICKSIAETQEKLYTREEVEKLCRAAYELGELEGYSEGLEGADIEQWLKENL